MGVVKSRLATLAFLGLSAAIGYNAMFLQKGHHPAPLSSDNSHDRLFSATDAGGKGKATGLPEGSGQNFDTEMVQAIQRELAGRGYDPGPQDGLAGLKTLTAIAQYQRDKGLEVTGQPSPDVLKSLLFSGALGMAAPDVEPSPALSAPAPAPASDPQTTASTAPAPAVADANVKDVQQVLAELGYAPGPVDGVMGDATHRAIETFERERGMAVTGNVSAKLVTELERITGRKLSGNG